MADETRVEDVIQALEELPDVDQARMEKMARLMAAKRWPHDLDTMTRWTPTQFRASVDALREEEP